MNEKQPTSTSNLRLGYLNSVILLGRLTADPDLRYTPRGVPVCSFRIAVNRRLLDKESNEWRDETYFFTVNTFAQTAERIGERLKKGSAVLIQGELRSRSWETPTGEKRVAVEIFGRSVQLLDRSIPIETSEPEQPTDEEPDIPKDQLDDIPF